MTEELLFSLDDIKEAAEKVKKELAVEKKSDGVIKRVLHTRTEITIYPNGDAFQKSSSWFDKKTYKVTKKIKKTTPVTKTVEHETEEY